MNHCGDHGKQKCVRRDVKIEIEETVNEKSTQARQRPQGGAPDQTALVLQSSHAR